MKKEKEMEEGEGCSESRGWMLLNSPYNELFSVDL